MPDAGAVSGYEYESKTSTVLEKDPSPDAGNESSIYDYNKFTQDYLKKKEVGVSRVTLDVQFPAKKQTETSPPPDTGKDSFNQKVKEITTNFSAEVANKITGGTGSKRLTLNAAFPATTTTDTPSDKGGGNWVKREINNKVDQFTQDVRQKIIAGNVAGSRIEQKDKEVFPKWLVKVFIGDNQIDPSAVSIVKGLTSQFRFGYGPELTDADKEDGYKLFLLKDGLTQVRAKDNDVGQIHPDDVQLYQDNMRSFRNETASFLAFPAVGKALSKPLSGLGKAVSELSWVKRITGPSNAVVNGPAASAAQYEKLKTSLALEEIQSVVNTTEHGAMRLISRGFSPSEITALKTAPDKIMTQGDGAKVFVKNLGDGKFNVIVESENGVVTALKNIGEKSLNNLAKNYEWK